MQSEREVNSTTCVALRGPSLICLQGDDVLRSALVAVPFDGECLDSPPPRAADLALQQDHEGSPGRASTTTGSRAVARSLPPTPQGVRLYFCGELLGPFSHFATALLDLEPVRTAVQDMAVRGHI